MSYVQSPKLFPVLFCLFVAAASNGFAATNSGLDTPPGVTSLPLSVQGNEGMDLVQQGNGSVYVGVGTAAPQAPLDVNGGMRGLLYNITEGTTICSPEGVIAYDMTNSKPVYCSNKGVWTTLNQQFANASTTLMNYNGGGNCDGVTHSFNLSPGNYGLPLSTVAVQLIAYIMPSGGGGGGPTYLLLDSTSWPSGAVLADYSNVGSLGPLAGPIIVTADTHGFYFTPQAGVDAACFLMITGYWY